MPEMKLHLTAEEIFEALGDYVKKKYDRAQDGDIELLARDNIFSAVVPVEG